MEQKIDAAMRRQYIAQGRMGMTPYARPQLSTLGGMGMGMFGGPFGVMGGGARRRTMPQLSMTGKKLSVVWNALDLITQKWPDISDQLKKVDVWDATVAPSEALDSTNNKDKILVFDDDVQNDYWASMLSPNYGGPIQINVPVSATYKSPRHYIEGMKILCSSSPGMLFGGVAQSVFSGNIKMDACDYARSEIDYILGNPHADVVVASTSVCNLKAESAGFYKIESEPCKFWTSLWLALYSKHMNRGAVSSRGSYQSALLSTGKKLLVYANTAHILGVNTSGVGLNGVGIILMILRAIAQKGLLVEENAGPAWEKIAKPILLALIKDDGFNWRT